MPDPDYTNRLATLEAFHKCQAEDLSEMKEQMKAMREVVEEIRRDLHAARMAGRVGIATAMALGGLGTWLINHVIKT